MKLWRPLFLQHVASIVIALFAAYVLLYELVPQVAVGKSTIALVCALSIGLVLRRLGARLPPMALRLVVWMLIVFVSFGVRLLVPSSGAWPGAMMLLVTLTAGYWLPCIVGKDVARRFDESV
jgi:uncharacterized membrane protein